MGCIYAIVNKLNNHRYVGSAKDFNVRRRLHLSRLNLKTHHSKYLQRAWYKYGSQFFEFIIIEDGIEPCDLIKREQWWFDNTICQYNNSKVAGSSLGVKRSAETKEKLRLVQLGRVHPEWRRKLKSESQGGIKHYNYGKKLSDETRRKKSNSMLIRYQNGFVAPNTKPVIKMTILGEYINEFPSVLAAANFNKKTRKGITQCLTGKNKTAYGYKWKYK